MKTENPFEKTSEKFIVAFGKHCSYLAKIKEITEKSIKNPDKHKDINDIMVGDI